MKKELTKREKFYLNVMKSGNVAYLKAPPGTGKSAIFNSIAKKIGYQYIDIRLSMIDETDLLFPKVKETEIENDVFDVIDSAIPLWAVQSNKTPTIIHFEELNRASVNVRNATLGILLEKTIGRFKFNKDVLMCASGNLGEQDGTEVEELDSALNNRLIHIQHDLTPEEWLSEFANDNVHPSICEFIKVNPSMLFEVINNKNDNGNDNPAYATARSWTMLSNYLISTYGKNITSELIDDVANNAGCFIGNYSVQFVRYLHESQDINMNDILEKLHDSEELVAKVKKMNRSRVQEIMTNVKSIDIRTISMQNMKNLVAFMNMIVDKDQIAGYIQGLIDSKQFAFSEIKTNENVNYLFKSHKAIAEKFLNI